MKIVLIGITLVVIFVILFSFAIKVSNYKVNDDD